MISMLEKQNWFRFTDLITLVLLMGKWMGLSVLGEKSSFKMLWLTFSSKLDWDSCTLSISIAKTASKKIGALIRSVKFLLRLLCISINLPYARVWSTVVTSGLVPLVGIWNC